MTRKPAAQRKAEMIEAALRLAEEAGPERLTTTAIAQAVGLSQAAVFRHFATKQAIWSAVAAHLSDLMQARWSQVAAQTPQGLQRLQDLAEAQLHIIAATPALPAILFSRELHVENAVLQQHFLSLVKQLNHHLVRAAELALAEGSLPTRTPPTDVAALTLSIIQSLALRWSLSGRQFDLVREGQRLLKVLIRNLQMPE
ncbi:TetR/AcrR family transcriptional regulator [Magnetospira thiophila]